MRRHRRGLGRVGWDLDCLRTLALMAPAATRDCLREDLDHLECVGRGGTPSAAALRAAIAYIERCQLRRRRARLSVRPRSTWSKRKILMARGPMEPSPILTE